MCSNDTAVQIPLYSRHGVIGYTLVDAADADFVNQWRWGRYDGYVRRQGKVNGKPCIIQLHRELMGLVPGDGLQVDHINRDKADNRRSNLRVVTYGQQMQNKPSYRGSSSQYRGVHWFKDTRKWRATVHVDGKCVSLGLFTSEEEAAAVAREARARLLPYAVD